MPHYADSRHVIHTANFTQDAQLHIAHRSNFDPETPNYSHSILGHMHTFFALPVIIFRKKLIFGPPHSTGMILQTGSRVRWIFVPIMN